MHIGLVGGIGPAATDFYYRRLIARFAGLGIGLEATIVHADTATLLANLARSDVAAQVAIYRRLADRLVAAGAGCIAITSIAGHFCIDAFKAEAPLPVIDLIAEVTDAITAQGHKRLGILGTRTVMATRLYGARTDAEIVPPGGDDLDAVHDAYVAMAASGVATPAQRAVFLGAGRRLIDAAGVEAIILGGTDLALVFDEADAPFAVIDCAGLHADAIVRFATA